MKPCESGASFKRVLNIADDHANAKIDLVIHKTHELLEELVNTKTFPLRAAAKPLWQVFNIFQRGEIWKTKNQLFLSLMPR